ncbi:hypothetical protein BVX95_01215 [archaeon D22]|nr:hypothetical protein BVX95_01215 [archaeon D22]
MNILILILFFAVSIYLLIKSSDRFVDSATVIADKFGVSHFIIGLTVVSIGTSLPELGAAVAASLVNNSDIVLGDIVGSNIANTAFVLGVGVLMTAIKIKKSHFKVDGPLLLLITLIFLVMGLDGIYTLIDGILLMLLFVFYILFLVQRDDLVTEAADDIKIESKKINTFVESLIILLSVGVLFASAKLLVYSGENIASFFGISDAVIGLVGIAIGTSLPELAVTISSAKKGNAQLLLGNVIGSNISNILLIGGVSALIAPIIVSASMIFMIFPILAIVTVLLIVFMRLKSEFRTMEGVSLLLIYMLFLIVSVYAGVSH